MQGHRVICVATAIKAHSPHSVTTPAYSEKLAKIPPGVGAWHHGPRAPVPVQSQSRLAEERAVVSYSPHVVTAACYCVKFVGLRANIRARDLGPCAPVPMQRQGPGSAAIAISSYGPNVVATAAHCVETGGPACMRAWHHSPRAAIP